MRQYWQSLNVCYNCGGVVDRYAIYCAHCGSLADRNPRLYFNYLPSNILGRAHRERRSIEVDPRIKRKSRDAIIWHELMHVKGFDFETRHPKRVRFLVNILYHGLFLDYLCQEYRILRYDRFSLRWIAALCKILLLVFPVISLLLFIPKI